MKHVLSLIVVMSLLAVSVAAGNPLYEDSGASGQNPLYDPVSAAVITVVTDTVTGGDLSDGMYVAYQDGDDIILRKRPGRTTYGDITLKKGYARCVLGNDDCDDTDTDQRPDAAYRMNKAELIEAIASEAGLTERKDDSGLSKADAKKALDMFVANMPPGHITVLKAKASVTASGPFVVQWKRASGHGPDFLDPDDDADGILTIDEVREDDKVEYGIDKKDIRRNEEGRKGLNAVNVKVLGIVCCDGDSDGDGLGDLIAELAKEHHKDYEGKAIIGRANGDLHRAEPSISKRSARTGRNAQTRKEIQIAAKNVVRDTPNGDKVMRILKKKLPN